MSGTTSTDGSGLYILAPQDYDFGDGYPNDELLLGGVPPATTVMVTLSQASHPVAITATGGATVLPGPGAGAGNTVTITGTAAAVNATLATLVVPGTDTQLPTTDTISITASDALVTTGATVSVTSLASGQGFFAAPSRLQVSALVPVALPAIGFADYGKQEAFYGQNFLDSPQLTVTLTAGHGTFFPAGIGTDPAVLFGGIGTGTLTITGGETVVRAALAALRYDGSGSADAIAITAVASDGTTVAQVSIPVTLVQPATGGSFSWAGPDGASWQAAADWAQGGTAASRPPNGGDAVTLPTDSAAVAIVGPGSAASLSVTGSYVLADAVAVAGALSVAGRLQVSGTATDPAALVTDSAAVAGEVDLTTGSWSNAGALQITGSGTLEVRNEAALTTGSLSIGANALLSVVSASTLTASGTITVDDAGGGAEGASNGTAVIAGNLLADSLVLHAGAGVLTKGSDTLNSLVVDAGGLFGGVSTVSTASGGRTAITNNGTIDGPVGLLPLNLKANIVGTGQLVIDAGGGMALGGPVAATQTVVFRPGDGPLALLNDGSAGGVLLLSDVEDFNATVTGLTADDSLLVTDATPITQVQFGAGNKLALLDANGNTVGSIQLDPAASYAGQQFTVQDANAGGLESFDNGTVRVRVEPQAQTDPVINTTGGARVLSGLGGVLPLVSVRYPQGLPTSGVTYTNTITASSGTLNEVVSLAGLFNTMGAAGGFSTAPGDGSTTQTDVNGNATNALTIQGTGTSQLTLSSSLPFFLNLQTALTLYQATGSTGANTITITSTATGNGVHESATTSVTMQVTTDPVAYAWKTGGGQSGLDPANWISSDGTAGPPGAGDPTTFGPGSYAVTGDISTGDLRVTGYAFLSGAIYARGSLTVDQQGGASFGGALDVVGDAVIGQQGAGAINLSGLISEIDGNLVVGGGAEGYLQTDGIVLVSGRLQVGSTSNGALDLGSNTASGNLIAGGALDTQAADIGVAAGVAGTVVDDNGAWIVGTTLTVGLGGSGRLQIASASRTQGEASVQAADLVIGANAGSIGLVSVTDNSQLQVADTITVGQAGTGLLTLTGDGGLYNIQSGNPQPNLVLGAAAGGTGTLLVTGGTLYAGEISVGGTAAASGGTGVLQSHGVAPDTFYHVPTPTPDSPSAGTTLYVRPSIMADSLVTWSGATVELGDGAITTIGAVTLDGGSMALGAGTAAIFGTVTVNAGTLTISPDTLTINTVQRGSSAFMPGLVVAVGGTVIGAATPAPISGYANYSSVAATNAGTITASGGLLDLGTVDNSGRMEATAGATLELETLTNTGSVLAQAGGIVLAPKLTSLVDANGHFIAGQLSNAGTFGTVGGIAEIESAVQSGQGGGTLAISGGGTLQFGDGSQAFSSFSDAGQTVVFGGAGHLVLDDSANGFSVNDPPSFASAIIDFGTGDTIDLISVARGIVSYANGILMLDNGYSDAPGYDRVIRNVSFNVGTGYTIDQFNYATIAGGSELTVTVACYCPGTCIAVPGGETTVEDLHIGEPVLTAAGTHRPIRWIGRRSYAGAFAARNPDVLPVRIAAGALGEGLPRRDLFVSPLHALLLDGALVPAHLLVNGRSIVQLTAPDQVEYIHIELDSHDILLAEGAPAESFVDDQSRGMFHNAAEFALLYPEARPMPARYCAPRLEQGEALEVIRARLAALAEPLPCLGLLHGVLDTADHDHVTGWARDLGEPDARVTLEVVIDGVVRGEVCADAHRADLEAAGEGDGRHGFDFGIPGGLQPGLPHTVEVRRGQDGTRLRNVPLLVPPRAVPPPFAAPAAPKPADPLRSAVDDITRERLTGWAWQPGCDAPVALQVLDNGVPLVRIVANAHRPDLRRAGIGSGRHAFYIVIPGGLSPLTRHVIEVRRESDGAALDGSPVVLEAVGAFDAALEAAVDRAIAGVDQAGGQHVLSFLLAQTERLLARQATAEGGTAERHTLQQFRRRWGSEAEAAPATTRPRALVIDARLPQAGHDAGSDAVLSHMTALRTLGYDVAIVDADDMRPGNATLAAAGVTTYGRPLYASVEDLLRRQAGCFDLVYLHRGPIAARYLALVRRYAPAALVLFSVADLHHLRLSRQAVVENRPKLAQASRRLGLEECAAAAAADLVLTHSGAEAAALRRVIPGVAVHVVPWAVPAVPPGRARFATRRGLAFIGSYAHDPNVDAAAFLVREVMPLVWQRDPAMPCLLVGSAMPDSVRALAGPGVDVLGHVPDLAAVFDRVRLTVAPLRFGAGVKGKVLTSLAARTPCVMTPVAAEGLDLPARLRSLVGDDAAGLAGLILDLHDDAGRNRAAGRAGFDWVRRRHDQASVVATLAAAIGSRGGAVGGEPRVARAAS